ncbi:hypothetical protein M0C34_12600 [Agarivorans sp. TSD2052]|uniref:hypothetical protein n=1 Tax=Agarivorans sp. TSD2052 TaxID=2937286 RepID=UPI00200D0805|nr:hypothetical protein [Agarivorans sp. TSD2052]UPW17088.1 hypothetical protein M0C34_12600 [Agarivorans sp. TSD2052]
MRKKLPPDQLELYKRIDEILFYKWDPIGISDGDWARDEYQSYLLRVFTYAIESDSPDSIAKYLGVVSTESMGLSAVPEHDMNIAKMIIEVKEGLGL